MTTARTARIEVRAPRTGEGAAIADLWRELWDAHEGWGGYAGSRDPRVYAHVAAKLDQDARARSGRPLLGRHAHVVATAGGGPCGQVEGWLERLGSTESSPLTCEVRSLIVSERHRATGAGRALLDALSETARTVANDAPFVLAAEVLDPNPARNFYARLGYAEVAWAARIETAKGAAIPPGLARFARRKDALAVAGLEVALAERRRVLGDTRFDPPSPVDAASVEAIAAALAAAEGRYDGPASLREPAIVVVLDRDGVVRGAASSAIQTLDPPFLPVRRALIGRFAVDPACAPGPVMRALVSFGCRWAASHGAVHAELTDLPAPGTPLYEAAIAVGARPWSRVVVRRYS